MCRLCENPGSLDYVSNAVEEAWTVAKALSLITGLYDGPVEIPDAVTDYLSRDVLRRLDDLKATIEDAAAPVGVSP